MTDGTFVKELVGYTSKPTEFDNVLALPNGWNAYDPAQLIKPAPVAEALAVYSLGAVRDYLSANRDKLELGTLVAQVVSPQIVRVVSQLRERAREREVYVQAKADNLTDNFVGKFMPIDEFMVGLLTRFEDGPDRQAVLKLFGNVKHEAVRTSADNGVTQTVTAKTGVVLAADVAVPSPVTLTPFRTFREVLQPASPFVLRVNAAANGTLSVGIFEADGGAWRLIAVDRVRDWLKAEVSQDVAILA